jgi:hypothetical protein
VRLAHGFQLVPGEQAGEGAEIDTAGLDQAFDLWVLGGRAGQHDRQVETQRGNSRLGEGAEDGGWGRAVGHWVGASRQSSPTPTDGARHCITQERASGSRGERFEKWALARRCDKGDG